jgi:Ca2+-binding EF-hand superfamily protein
MLRALNLAPTQAECEKRGQTQKAGQKTVSVEEVYLVIFNEIWKMMIVFFILKKFLAIYAEFYKMPEKTWGTFEDFMEGLKLYDKDQNGQLSLSELSQVLVMMGIYIKIFNLKIFINNIY